MFVEGLVVLNDSVLIAGNGAVVELDFKLMGFGPVTVDVKGNAGVVEQGIAVETDSVGEVDEHVLGKIRETSAPFGMVNMTFPLRIRSDGPLCGVIPLIATTSSGIGTVWPLARLSAIVGVIFNKAKSRVFGVAVCEVCARCNLLVSLLFKFCTVKVWVKFGATEVMVEFNLAVFG